MTIDPNTHGTSYWRRSTHKGRSRRARDQRLVVIWPTTTIQAIRQAVTAGSNWAKSMGAIQGFGIEGHRILWSAGLSRFLRERGIPSGGQPGPIGS